MIAIIDYGAGNIFSVKNALDYLGIKGELTSSPRDIENADGIILPGVGAFPWAMKKLSESGLVDLLKHQAAVKPFMGICLGMQLLFEKSFEFEECTGLSLIKGYVDIMDEPELVIPHMGWNKLECDKDCKLLEGIGDDEFVYFVHSYYADAAPEHVIATTEYGAILTAAVAKDNVIGCQFHPEKSGPVGLKILKRFCDL